MEPDGERALFGAWVSPYFWFAAHVLREAGLDFDYVRVSPFTGANRGAAHYEHNPLGKVPTLRDGGTSLSESLALSGAAL